MRHLSLILMAGATVALGGRSSVGQVLGTRPTLPTASALPALDRVETANHPAYEGLIESEDSAWINLIQIRRRPGQPMHLVLRPIDRRSVTVVERLNDAQRAKLRREIERFRNRAAIETGRMEAVTLKPAQAEGNRYLRYEGRWFSLDSTADEPTTRRLIVRAEQIFAAYRQILAPRVMPARPPRLIVFGSGSEYQAFLTRRGLKIQNRACYLEPENLVVVGSDLARFASHLKKIHLQNQQLRKDLEDLDRNLPGCLVEIARQMKQEGHTDQAIKQTLVVKRRWFDDQIKKKRAEVERTERDNVRTFNTTARQSFARLYHESFHAYLENYVYPHQQYDVPLWLNEGLAVMFEGGLLEGDTLRVDAPDATELRTLKTDLQSEAPLSLAELLAGSQKHFLLADNAAPLAAERYYAHAWGLVYYLTFEKQLLSTAALDRYVRPEARTLSPERRFQELVNTPPDTFEAEWRKAMQSLRAAGTIGSDARR